MLMAWFVCVLMAVAMLAPATVMAQDAGQGCCGYETVSPRGDNLPNIPDDDDEN